jgi:hypothetical protein
MFLHYNYRHFYKKYLNIVSENTDVSVKYKSIEFFFLTATELMIKMIRDFDPFENIRCQYLTIST